MAERICVETDCDRRAVARGRCHRHYYRWRRKGDTADLFGTCSADGCSTGVFALKLCYLHYTRQQTGVDLDQPRRYGRAVAERFWELVERDWDCWVWQGRRNADGYGSFDIEDGRNVLAHRFAYELLVGPIPDGYDLDHLCNYRDCVDPTHMEPVTHAENVRRAWARKEDLLVG